jgi:hypothetical protein
MSNPLRRANEEVGVSQLKNQTENYALQAKQIIASFRECD